MEHHGEARKRRELCSGEGEGRGEREKEREGEREGGERESEREREKGEADMEAGRQADRQVNSWAGIETERQTGIYRLTESQKQRQRNN